VFWLFCWSCHHQPVSNIFAKLVTFVRVTLLRYQWNILPKTFVWEVLNPQRNQPDTFWKSECQYKKWPLKVSFVQRQKEINRHQQTPILLCKTSVCQPECHWDSRRSIQFLKVSNKFWDFSLHFLPRLDSYTYEIESTPFLQQVFFTKHDTRFHWKCCMQIF